MHSPNPRQHLIEQLSRERARHLTYLARRVSSQADREDIVQQAYGKALTHIEQLRDEDKLDAWFRGILRRSIADFYASRANELRRREELEQDPVVFGQSPSTTVEQGAFGMCHCGEAFMEGLSQKTAELVRRVDIEQESPSEVAPDLGLTANTARVRLHRAHARLREELRNHCGGGGDSYRDYLDCECTGC